VATQTVEALVPEKGIEPVSMALRAEDLDDDRYVKSSQGGTDCNDDDPGVNPGIGEVCDGKDDNCSGDETDAPGVLTYYVDEDKDGYGNPARRQLSCVPLVGTVTNGRDCDDTNAAVHPDQAEALCDGKDENCNNLVDDSFQAGMSCATAQGCTGAFVCSADQKGSQCVSAQVPAEWFVDEDGDQHAGKSIGLWCVPPVAGAVKTSDDCDDSSPFVSAGATERCDRLDNNCNSQVDEGGCDVDWHPATNSIATELRAVSAYAEGKAWVAGLGGVLAHVQADVATSYPDCAGEWVSAWARPSDGRVFLGSNDGKLATHAVTGGVDCSTSGENASTGSASSVNGLVGFENGATTTLFAVTSDGSIYRWIYPGGAAPEKVTQVAANLRSIHGTSPTNLLAVGALNSVPRAFHSSNGSTWDQETLPASLPPGLLYSVYMVHSQLAYAAGDQGMVLERSNGVWKEATGPSTKPTLWSIRAYARTSLHAVSPDKTVYLFSGTWQQDQLPTWTPRAIDGVGPHDLWVVGSQGKILHRGL
jgi:hypothetical protein